jgi:hypothetical protein
VITVVEEISDAGLRQAAAVAEPEDTVSLVIETGVDRDPLDPRLKLRIVLHSLGGVDLKLVVQNLEIWQPPFRHEPLHERRCELGELQQQDGRGPVVGRLMLSPCSLMAGRR